MRVVVTGSAGYIGRVLCERLVELGHDVTGIDTGYFKGCEIGHAPTGWPVRALDVRDITPADLAGAEAVCHLAALSNDPLGALDEAITNDVNCHGTLTVAEAARAAGVSRFVFASSCSIYGKRGDEILDESAPLAPLTAYARSKVEAERALSAMAGESFSPTYLRNATAFGWSPCFRFDLVVNNLVGWALATGEVRLLSDGSAWRPLVHVRDIADAFAAALEAPRELVHDQAVNVGDDRQNVRIADLAGTVQRVIPGTRVTKADDAPADDRSYRVSFEKAARALPGFRAAWDVERGVREIVAELGSAGFAPATFEDPRFTRVRWLTGLKASGRLDNSFRWA